MMGQLPKERVTPDAVFNNVGLDYAGPVYLKRGSIRKPVIVKAYICIFVSLAVHIEAVSDLTSEAFLACLRTALLWSDHGTNFVGAKRILKDCMNEKTPTISYRTIASIPGREEKGGLVYFVCACAK